MTEKCGIRTHSEIYKTGSREYSLLFMGSTVFALRTDRYSEGFYRLYGRFLPSIRDSLDLEYLKRFFKVKRGIPMYESKIHFRFVYHSLLINWRSILCSFVMTKDWSVQHQFDWKRGLLAKNYKIFREKNCLHSF